MNKQYTEKIIDSYLSKAINESRNLLTERVSSIVYHWCSPQTAVKILNTNRFSLMNNLFKAAESDIIGTSHKRMWYMSLTRNGKIGMGGYSNGEHTWVRLTLDGDKLNSRYHTKAIDYWGAEMGKNARYQNARKDGTKIKKPSIDTESEDRLYSKKPFIEDATSYIKVIDIYFDISRYDGTRNSFVSTDTVESVVYIALSQSNICKLYTSIKDFNNNKNPISNETLGKWFDNQKETRDLNYYDLNSEKRNMLPDRFLASIVYIVNFLDGDLNSCIRTLMKYGLEKYAKGVAKTIKNNKNWYTNFYFGDKSSYRLEDIKKIVLQHFEEIHLSNSAQSLNREDLARAFSILSDFCAKNRLKTKYDIIKFFAKKLHKEDKIVKGNQIIDITCARLHVNDSIHVCINPTKTRYVDIFGKEYLSYLYDDLKFYVDEHKSKNSLHFKLYLNKLLFKGQPTVQDIIELYDRLKSLGNDRLDLDYKPELITKQVSYWDIYYVLENHNYEYGSRIHTLDNDYIHIKGEEQYNQLRELVDSYAE